VTLMQKRDTNIYIYINCPYIKVVIAIRLNNRTSTGEFLRKITLDSPLYFVIQHLQTVIAF
jgi:hypothetical protein